MNYFDNYKITYFALLVNILIIMRYLGKKIKLSKIMLSEFNKGIMNFMRKKTYEVYVEQISEKLSQSLM